MTFSIKNKVVLVTGASSGIGRETAKAFARKGARVALTGRNIEALETTIRYLKNEGCIVGAFPFDLTNFNKIPKMVEDVQKYFGDSVDVLVNSAGIAILGLVEDVPADAYHRNLQINFFAPLELIKAVIPGMKKKRDGQIINISSGVGKNGLPGVSSYCVSKFALNALTESLRIELAPYNIKVILFSPGLVATGFNDRIEIYGELKEKFTGGKMAAPEETAEIIVQVSENAKREVVLSLRTKMGYHLNYWAPSLFDFILKCKFFKNNRLAD
jgi:short-subunit dehydrogenase